jgi:hypothetical protein
LHTASRGVPPLKSNGFATSTNTFPARCLPPSPPACSSASSEPVPAVALITSSPNAAASSNDPSLAAPVTLPTHATAFSLPASREPIRTSWPSSTSFVASV